MVMTHSEQRVAALREGMTARGIGSIYHERTLRENAPGLFENIATIVQQTREGRGIIFVGTTKAYDETILVARALYLQGVPPMVTRPLTLAQAIVRDDEEMTATTDSSALFVLGFADKGDCPLSYRERQILTEFVSDWIDNGKAFFCHSPVPLAGNTWWSAEFVERISRVTSVRVCK